MYIQPCYTLTRESVFALVLLQASMTVRKRRMMPTLLLTDAVASLTQHTHTHNGFTTTGPVWGSISTKEILNTQREWRGVGCTVLPRVNGDREAFRWLVCECTYCRFWQDSSWEPECSRGLSAFCAPPKRISQLLGWHSLGSKIWHIWFELK